jgi:hypothetical protein
MQPIIHLSQTHSHVAPYRAIIFEWLDDVATMVCFTDFHELVASPQRNMKPVWDLAFMRVKHIASIHIPHHGWDLVLQEP